MAIVYQDVPLKSSVNKYRMRAVLWIVGAIVILVLMVLLWMFSKTVDNRDKQETSENTPINSVKNINITNKITELDDLSYSVKPIEFKTIIRDLRSYPDEFIDHRYLKDLKGKWTIQVMDVEAHDVISDYLDSREDREGFAYFRYTDEKNHQRYVLIYEIFTSLQEVMDNANATNFGLPKSVKIIPEEINRYLSLIDNYERAEEVHDLSGSRPRSIILKKTSRLLPVKRVIPKAKPKVKRTVLPTVKRKPRTNKSSVHTKQSLSDSKSSQSLAPKPKKTNQVTKPKPVTKVTPVQTPKPAPKATPVQKPKPKPEPKTQTTGSKPTPFVPN